MDQKNYAVYDSSVAVCLNALQLNQNISEGYVFNYVKACLTFKSKIILSIFSK